MRSDEDFQQEIEAHIALETDRLIADGMSPADARDRAMRAFGNLTHVRERFYESRRIMLFDHLRQDVRYALRSFARSPLFALTAVLSLAIGIAADTTVFTVANALLFRTPAGVTDPGALVDISRSEEGGRFGINEISFLNYLDMRERATTLAGVYGYEPFAEPMSLAGPSGAERIFGHNVTPNYFAVLGVRPAIGRLFESERQDSSGTVVLSHRFWTRRFEQDPSIVGQTLTLNSQPYTVVGIATERFQGTSVLATDVWVPMNLTPAPTSFLLQRELPWALVRGRLKSGVSVAQAAAEVDSIGRALEQEYPADNGGRGLRLAAASLVPGNLAVPLGGVMALVLGFVSLVLIIACANLAGILLARATARRREIAVRLAVGAGRRRLVQQLLTETLLLFAAGGAAGLWLARGMTSLVVSLLPAFPVPVDLSFPLDGRVMAFTIGLSLVAAVLCGVAPALHASKADVVAALKDDAPGASGRSRLRHGFVVAQVALTLVLVVGAGLFLRALQKATSFDPGFDPRGVELAELDLSLAGYTLATGPQFIGELVSRVGALPAVQHASAAAVLPVGGRVRYGYLTHPGVSSPGRGFLDADWNAIEPGYFATLRIPLVAGRDFSADDRAGAASVVIVSAEAARRFWPGQDAIGKFLLQHAMVFRRGQSNEPTTLQVIGIAADVKARPDGPVRPQVYLSFPQLFSPRLTIIARTTDGQRIPGEIRGVVASMNPNLPILTAQTLEGAATFGLLPQRVAASVSGSLGLVGLLLAAIGIYGVMAYAVTLRTREIGIRIALGAARASVVGIVLRQGMSLVAVGAVIGLTLAATAASILARVFFPFPRMDAVAVGVTLVVLAITGLAACYVPVRRAMQVDPVTALRYE